MTVAIGDVLKCAARVFYDGVAETQIGVFHYESVGPAETDAQSLLNMGVVIENLYLQVDNFMSNVSSFVDITVYNLTQDSLLGVTPWPTLVNGAAIGERLPPQVCALILGHTGVLGHQARKYLGCFIEPDQANGLWLAAVQVGLANFVTQYILPKVAGGITYKPVVAQLGVPITTIDITSGSFVVGTRTQRRRTLGRGV